MKKVTITVLLIMFVLSLCMAQEAKLSFDHYNVKDGLPESFVRALIQDEQGYIWMGTQNGLVKYDGYDFKVYRPTLNDTTQSNPDGRNFTSLLQSKDGKIWAGTVFGWGVINFDPNTQKFTSYYPPKDSLTGFGFDNCQILMEDRKERIWVAVGSSVRNTARLAYLEPKTSTFTLLPIKDANNLLPDLFAAAIAEDKYGNVWIGDKHKGIYKHIVADSVQHFFPAIINPKDSLSPLELNHISIDSQQIMWVATTQGLHAIDLLSEEITPFKHDQNDDTSLPNDTVQLSYQDKKGNVWISTKQGGLNLYKRDKKQFQRFSIKKELVNLPIKIEEVFATLPFAEDEKGIWFLVDHRPIFFLRYNHQDAKFTIYDEKFNHSDNIANRNRSSFLLDKSNLLWIGNAWGGLNRQNPTNQRIDNFKHDPALKNSLPDDVIFNVFEDSHQDIWISTGNGLARFQPENQSFENYHLTGEGATFFTKIFEDSKGRLWIGSAQGLMLYDRKTNQLIPYLEDLVSKTTPMGNITPRLEDKNGNIWLGCWGCGVVVFNPNSKQIIQEFTENTANVRLDINYPWHFLKDTKERVWFSTNKALCRYDLNHEKFTSYFSNPVDSTALSNNELSFVMQDSKGRIWIGTDEGGINLYREETDDFTSWRYLNIFSSIPTGYEDKQGNLWFGTYSQSGLNKFDPVAETLTIYGEEEGLACNNISVIVEDDYDCLWLPTERGLSRFNPLTETFQNYGESDGFIPDKFGFFLPTFIKTSSGKIWGGRNNGLHRIDPKKLMEVDTIPPQVWITNLQLGNKNYAAADGELLKKHLSFIETLHLDYFQNDFTLSFIGLHYAEPSDNQYSYLLENYETIWSPPTKIRKVRYTNLNPGEYVFKVKASNADGVWTKEGRALKIIIAPPWWQTWWARSLFALAFLGILYAIRSMELRKQQVKLEREQAFNRQLQSINRANEKFVPQKFLQILGKKSITDLQLGNQTATKMTVLFADIRDYTGLSETMNPEDNFRFINGFLGRMGPIIETHGGFICQYFGDGMMALFKENYSKAVQAAIEMQQTIQTYNQKRISQDRVPIKVGIGLNTGQLMLGVIGDKNRYDSSVISDAVNTASRMEGLTKIFGCMLIISESTLQELRVSDTFEVSYTSDIPSKNVSDTLKVSDTMSYRFLGKVKVKGKKVALNIYDFYDGDPIEVQQLKTETKADFEKALHFYFDKDFGKAADLLKDVLEKYPADKAATYYFEKALLYVTDGVSETWSGVEEMISK